MEREAFEKFVRNKWDALGAGVVKRTESGKYAATHVETMWETWQAALAQPAQEQWNAALDEAAARIGEIKGFEQATQDSFAVYIKGLKK